MRETGELLRAKALTKASLLCCIIYDAPYRNCYRFFFDYDYEYDTVS